MQPGWTPTTVAGRPADVFDPPGRRGVLLYLHPPGDDLARDWPALTAALLAHRLGCVAPGGVNPWWVGEAERHVVDGVVPWVRAAWGASKLAAVGVGTGGQGAVRLGFRRPDLLPVVGSLGGAFDFHALHGRDPDLDALYPSAERARLDTAVLHLNPQAAPPHISFACDPADGWWPGNDRLREKLTAYGVPHTCDLDAAAGGQSWAYFDARIGPLVGWAAAALASEGRRLV